jgi:hypothetical protein
LIRNNIIIKLWRLKHSTYTHKEKRVVVTRKYPVVAVNQSHKPVVTFTPKLFPHLPVSIGIMSHNNIVVESMDRATTARTDPLEIISPRCYFRPIDTIKDNDNNDVMTMLHDHSNRETTTWIESNHNTIISLEEGDHDDENSLFGMPFQKFTSDLEDELNVIDDEDEILGLDWYNNENVVDIDHDVCDQDDDKMSFSSDMLSVRSDVYDDDVFEYDDLMNEEEDDRGDIPTTVKDHRMAGTGSRGMATTIVSPTGNWERQEDELKVLRNQLWKQSLKISMFKKSTMDTMFGGSKTKSYRSVHK